MDKIQVKRIYNPPETDDGSRILVDRLWPRGVAKEDADLDGWCKQLAPSDDLRKWFDHDPGKWEEFRTRFLNELEQQQNLGEQFLNDCDAETLTLLYAAKDEEHNHAIVLKNFLESSIN